MPIFQPGPGGTPSEGSVSVQTWVPGAPYYDEVVRRNTADPQVRWALVTLNDDDEPDDQGAIPVVLS